MTRQIEAQDVAVRYQRFGTQSRHDIVEHA
jgi:hypothetical protein